MQQWFRQALGEPTPAQRQGWPAIRAGHHTLILAPTGSGKTLAAFLVYLDGLWRQGSLAPGVQLLYISPLKALNNDISRNLQAPLAGVAAAARQRGQPLPAIDVAVRTGDTTTAERQRLVRRPPQVLITTPESLHLLLTSRARETLRGVTHCIVDAIHALCPNKRGVFLSLLLERLQEEAPHPFIATCSRWRAGTQIFPWWPRRFGSACKTTLICRTCVSCWRMSTPARSRW